MFLVRFVFCLFVLVLFLVFFFVFWCWFVLLVVVGSTVASLLVRGFPIMVPVSAFIHNDCHNRYDERSNG